LSEGRLSAAATLRLLHRAIVRLFAPFLPYLTEEIWHWAYGEDKGMHDSVHCSPWPSLEEFAAIPPCAHEDLYAAAVAVMDAVRKAKADANLSMRAPVARVCVTGKAGTLEALKPAVEDLKGMLHIEIFDLTEGALAAGLVGVEATVAQAS